jgi:uncharacterized membrane protein YfcA
MVEELMREKNRNFKDIIKEQKKQKSRLPEAVMRRITSINTSILYGSAFLIVFLTFDVIIYWLLTPDILVWTIILIVSALLGSIFASRLTKNLKKKQLRYAIK